MQSIRLKQIATAIILGVTFLLTTPNIIQSINLHNQIKTHLECNENESHMEHTTTFSINDLIEKIDFQSLIYISDFTGKTIIFQIFNPLKSFNHNIWQPPKQNFQKV